MIYIYISDFAVGSFGSVTLFKARPVVKFKGKINSSPRELHRNISFFNISTCLILKSNYANISVKIKMSYDNRLTASRRKFTGHFKKPEEEICRHNKIYIKVSV